MKKSLVMVFSFVLLLFIISKGWCLLKTLGLKYAIMLYRRIGFCYEEVFFDL